MADINVALQLSGRDDASGAVENVIRALDRLDNSSRGIIPSLDSFGHTLSRGFQLAAGWAVLNKVAEGFSFIGDSAIGMNARLEQAQIGFETLLGSAQKAQSFIAQLAELAGRTPFTFPGLQDAAQRFLAMGFAVEEVLPLITDIGNFAAATGKITTEQFDRISLALGQMSQKTKVQAEEMRQLTEAGVPAWTILAEATGKPIPVLQELTKKGEIASDVFIKAFHDFSQARFGDLMEKQSQTFSGAMTTIIDNFQMGIAAGVKPFFEALSAGVVAVANFTRGDMWQTWVGIVSSAFSGLLGWIQQAISGFAPLGQAIRTAFEQLTAGDFSGALATLKNGFTQTLQELLAGITAFGASMWEAGMTLITTFAQGLLDGANSVLTAAVTFVAELIASFLIGQSPPPAGPLALIREGGTNTIIEYGAGIQAGFTEVMGVVETGVTQIANTFKTIDTSVSLDNMKQAFADAMGSAEGLEDASRGVDVVLREIARGAREITNELSDLKFQVEDIKQGFEDQLDPLERQLQLIRDRKDFAMEERDIELDIADQKNRQAILAAQGNKEEIGRLQSQQRSLQLAEQELRLNEQMDNLRAQAKKGKDTGDQMEILKNRMQQLEIAKQIAGQTDKEALGKAQDEKARISAEKEELGIQKQIDELMRKKEELPILQQIRDIKAAQAETLGPLEEQIRILERQRESVERQRQPWQDLKQDIMAALQAQRDLDSDAKRIAAEAKSRETAAKKAGGTGLASPAALGLAPGTDRLPKQSVSDQAKEAIEEARKNGQRMAQELANGFTQWTQQHMFALIFGALGTVFGGPLVGAIAALFGERLQQALAAMNISPADVGQGILRGFENIKTQLDPILQTITESILTVKQVFENDWAGDDTVNPTVRAVGNFAVVLRDQVIPAVQQFAQWMMTGFVPAVQQGWQAFQPWIPVLAGVAAAFATFVILTTVAGWIATAAAAIGTFLAVAGPFVTVIGMIVSSIAAGAPVFATLGAGLALLVSLLGGPVTVAIAAVAIAVGVMTAAWIGNWGDIQGKTATVVSWIQSIPGMISGAWETIQKGWESLSQTTGTVWSNIQSTITRVVQFVGSTIGGWLQTLQTTWNTAWQNISTTVSTWWNGTIIPALRNVMTIIGDIFLIALGLWYILVGQYWVMIFQKTLEIWNGIIAFFQTWWPVVAEFFTGQLTYISTLITTTWTLIQTVTTTIWTMISTFFMDMFWNPLVAFVTSVLTIIGDAITAAWTLISTTTITTWTAISEYFLNTFWNPLVQMVTTNVELISTNISTTWTNIQTETTRVWNDVKDFLLNTIWEPLKNETIKIVGMMEKGIRDPLVQLGSDAKQWGADIFSNFLEGLKAEGQKVLDYVKDVADKVKKMLSGSFENESPSHWAFEQGKFLFQGLELGIMAGADRALAAARSAASGIMGAISGLTAVPEPGTNAIADYIRMRATSLGIDPNVALAVAASEGGFEPARVGDHGSSFGPYQLHYGGIAGGGNFVPGEGDTFTAVTGLHASDPRAWAAGVDWALNRAKQGGWGPWHGWTGDPWAGISRYAQGGVLPEDITGFGKNGLYRLHAGEGVFNREQMRALGGMIMGPGTNGEPTEVVVHENHYHFHGDIMTEKDAARKVRRQMVKTGYNNVDLWPGIASRPGA